MTAEHNPLLNDFIIPVGMWSQWVVDICSAFRYRFKIHAHWVKYI